MVFAIYQYESAIGIHVFNEMIIYWYYNDYYIEYNYYLWH